MSNRLLSFFILVLIFASGYGIYYYFFVANIGNLSLIINGAESVSASIKSEFQNTYMLDCKRTCVFQNIPPVNYTITVKKDGYYEIHKNFKLSRGESKKIVITMEKEVKLTILPQEGTGAVVLPETDIEKLVDIKSRVDGDISTIKYTQDQKQEIVMTNSGVCIYDTVEGVCIPHQLYDDILPISGGDILTLVKKTSKAKRSLLNLKDDNMDYILLVTADRRNRKVLLKTSINGKYLQLSKNGKVVMIDTEGKGFEIENIN